MYTTLISANDLAMHLHPNWIVLDCRHDLANPDAGRQAFTAGHIDGAQFADVERDLSDKDGNRNTKFRGRHPLPDPDKFIATLRDWGIDSDSQVIAYDAQGGMFAARLWWMLRWVGHRAVAVLDGGLPAWTVGGLPLTTAIRSRAPGNITMCDRLVSTVSADDVFSNLSQATRVVVDARAPDRYRGENETLDPVGGHIPGARNRFFKDNLQADGHFKTATQLRAEFSALIDHSQNAVMQCGSGITACHHLLAMEIAGLPGAALYPGSWSEWCADPLRPIAVGDQPWQDI